jgi:hypothetical protein
VAAIIVLDVFVGIIAVVGLIAMWDQLRALRLKSSAKGVEMAVDQVAPRRKNYTRFQVNLRMVGPVVRYEVGLDVEADGNRYDVSTPKPEIRPSMGCDDEELTWGFDVPEEDLERIWVIASWVEAHGAGLRVAALAHSLSAPAIYEWKWAADWRLSSAGHWKRRRAAMTPPRAVPGLGPLERGRPPGSSRPAEPSAEPDEAEEASTES